MTGMDHPRRRRHSRPDPLARLTQMLERRFANVHRTLAKIKAQGVTLMAQNQQVLDFLATLNTYTNEIAADIDKLIADNDLSPAVQAAMQAHSDTLKAIAAKSGDPLPPPVVPPAT